MTWFKERGGTGVLKDIFIESPTPWKENSVQEAGGRRAEPISSRTLRLPREQLCATWGRDEDREK